MKDYRIVYDTLRDKVIKLEKEIIIDKEDTKLKYSAGIGSEGYQKEKICDQCDCFFTVENNNIFSKISEYVDDTEEIKLYFVCPDCKTAHELKTLYYTEKEKEAVIVKKFKKFPLLSEDCLQ